MLKRRHRRPNLSTSDKLFWVFVWRLWKGWQQSLAIVTPETVVRWHRAGFRLNWAWLSQDRPRVGRKPTSRELRELIFQMVGENPTWGAPRIHGELQMLGFSVSGRTVSRWVRRAPRDPEPAKRWLAFLHNHRELIAAMDFFTVPTATFGVIYCFFIIAHDRRRILHVKVTRHPTSTWVVQQLRETFPYQSPHRYVIFDRDAKFGLEVVAAVNAMGSQPIRTSFRSPWQNGVAERWVGSCRRDLMDHVIARDERHLKRVLFDYVRYYHDDRTHLGLDKHTPTGRAVSSSADRYRVTSTRRLGGLHHQLRPRRLKIQSVALLFQRRISVSHRAPIPNLCRVSPT